MSRFEKFSLVMVWFYRSLINTRTCDFKFAFMNIITWKTLIITLESPITASIHSRTNQDKGLNRKYKNKIKII